MSEELKVINDRLRDRFGTDIHGRVNWRVVWSETEFEKRLGYYPIGNTRILSEKAEVREVRKYSYIRDRHILERRIDMLPTAELPEASMVGYSYEPLYVFEDKRGNMLPVRWHPIEVFVRVALEGPKAFFTARTEQIERDKFEREDIEYFEALLEDNSPYLATMLHNKEAVFMDSQKRMKKDGE